MARGEDPKQVLKLCYDQAIKVDPKFVEAHLATARMALDKNDSKIASQAIQSAMKLDEKDPEIFFLAARAWQSTDESKASEYLKQSLQLNENYIPSLLMLVESKLDSEDFDIAEKILNEINKINPLHPKAWALRAAIHHLRGKYEDETKARSLALMPWPLNPEVDFVIGEQLSKHYRFAESVDYQRRSIKMKSDYVPAKSQLANDLLRLGKVDEGWKIVEEVRASNPYDVTIFNLKQLQSRLEQFSSIEVPGFVIRMDKKEAKVFGRDVAELLTEARSVLTKKYEVELEEPIYVEIFPRQKDFAIRTFGMPGGAGFLGVCFGRLITANSPSALQTDSNWKSVLWHEYCHVVTLQKTKNKMPRWLSEGISVYEERVRNATWGQELDPTYRTMILGEDFVPMSRLSGAFLHPKTPMHLQFAYYEASLAVEFWIEKYGMKAMHRLLTDLSIGMPADEALRRAPGTIEILDSEFLEYARAKANGFAPGADFARPDEKQGESWDDWLESHPQSYWALRRKAQSLIRSKKFSEALPIAEALRDLWHNDPSSDGAYGFLAAIYRGENDTKREREALKELAQRSSDAREALQRLLEIDRASNDWKSAAAWCDQLVEIQPMRSDVQTARAESNERIENWSTAARALNACAELEPIDPADIQYRLAKASVANGDRSGAKRHLLMSLEESPRFVEALQLLISLREIDSEFPDMPFDTAVEVSASATTKGR